MKLVPATMVAATLLTAVTGCSGSGTEDPERGASSTRAHHDHSSHDHHADDGDGSNESSGTHASLATLRASLLRPADLPTGYLSGSHHEQTEHASYVRAAPGCAPLALLLREHHATHDSHHPEVSASFSKSHFGPQITQKVVDYGTAGAAQAALDDLQATRSDCARYVHSTSSIGANEYAVKPGPRMRYRSGVSLRLTAVGEDFAGINWDVWSTRAGARVMTIAFRSAPGGDNADLAPVVSAALTGQRAGG